MRYFCLLVAEPGIALPAPGSPEFGQVMEDFRTSTKAMNDAGVVVSTGPLDPPETARTLRLRGGQPTVTDGPLPRSSRSSAAITCWNARAWMRR
jgi:hypothetical protein